MFVPLSLRICCIAVMAPALTEAATKPTRVKLPLCLLSSGRVQLDLESTKQLLSDATKQLVIERSSGLYRNHIGLVKDKNTKSIIDSDHHQREASIVCSKDSKGETASKYLSIGSKLLDLGNIVPHFYKESPVGTTKIDVDKTYDQFLEMNQPIRLYVNGTNGSSKMTVNSKFALVQEEVPAMKIHEKPHTVNQFETPNGSEMNVDLSNSSDCGGGGDYAEAASVYAEGNNGSGDAPAQINERESHCDSDMDMMVNEVTRRQHLQERRAQRLLRRLRRIQIRQSHGHISNQLSQYITYHHHNLETMAQSITNTNTSQQACADAEFKPEMLHSDDIKNLSTAALVNLVRKLQSVQSSPLSLKQRLSTQSELHTSVLRMSKTIRSESERVADQLSFNLRHLQSAVDSDATESSSGGESGEEYYVEPLRKHESVNSVTKTSAWQWARDRAEVAARWTWLQAQVSDLEYRIRTQSDIYRQLRSSKGSVQLAERYDKRGGVEASPANLNTILTNVDRQVSRVAQSLVPLTPAATPYGTPQPSPKRTMNGFVDATLDESCCLVAARCRPLLTHRKRRLFRTAGLYMTSHKAARLSSVRCRCWPHGAVSCIVCQGRYQHALGLDDGYAMPRNEKLAVLDTSYHPVLSFTEDVPLPIVMESLVRTASGLQTRTMPRAGRSPVDKPIKLRKKYARNDKSKKLKKSAASLLTMKYKSRLTDRAMSPKQSKRKIKETSRGLTRAELRKRKKLKLALKRERRALSSRLSSAQGSPCGSPLPSGSQSLRDMKNWMRRKVENAYDIDNIVIPYSIAASTRVQKLEYKEIITPKWRFNPVNETLEEAEVVDETDEIEEDLSDESYAARHLLCQLREKQRYTTFLTTGRKARGSMRTESGATTPDPIAETADLVAPYTPLASGEPSARRLSCSATMMHVTRSRTQSMSEERSRTNTPEPLDLELRPLLPQRPTLVWEPRVFPLSAACYQALLQESEQEPSAAKAATDTPSYQQFETWKAVADSCVTSVNDTPVSSRPVSPMLLSSDEDAIIEHDSDPEWTAPV